MVNERERNLIAAIQSGDSRSKHGAIEEIYSYCFPSISKHILTNKGTREDAKDIFQDGMTILYRDLLSNKFREESSLKTYLFSICRLLWLQRLRKLKVEILIPLEDKDHPTPDFPNDEINILVLKSLMEELKEDCRKLLTGFYYERKSMKQLMKAFRLGSEQVVRTKKLRCMDSLARLVGKKGMTFESFLL